MSTIKSSAENLTLNADGANNDVIIQSNASTKVTVDGATGNVGIGVASAYNPASGRKALTIEGTANASIEMAVNGARKGYIYHDATNLHLSTEVSGGDVILTPHSAGNVVVGGGAAPRVSITSNNANGSAAINFLSTTNNSKNWEVGSNLHNSDGLEFTPSTANGGSTFTTPTVSFPIAGGITFGSDTAAANALDDYEEASGTPVPKKGTTAISITGNGDHYVKIGSLVTYFFEFAITNLNSGSGNFTLALPFVSKTSSYATGSVRIYNGEVLGGEILTLHSASSTLNFNRIRNNTSTTSISPTVGGYYFGSISYRTN